MLNVLNNEKRFSILFFAILLIDILVKLYCAAFPYRYISKPIVLFILFLYYYINNKERKKKKKLWVIIALTSFFIGDILIINHTNIIFLGASLFCFSVAKIFLSFRFSHKADFNIVRLVPFSIIIFAYTVFIVSLLYDSLGAFFVPALFSFFLSLLLFQFAFLRKGVFDKVSYLYVFIGVILFIISESLMAIKTFKTDILLQDFLIMFLYGLALYLITVGIVKEKKRKPIVNSF
tara:strand:+ start:87 stop:788 length:702 start_codon:yes stop_codon:yes gene_type:complete